MASSDGVPGGSAGFVERRLHPRRRPDLDLVLTGNTGAETVSKIYRNDGATTFTDIGTPTHRLATGN